MQRFATYILYSQTLNAYYIGYTGKSVEEPLKEHLVLWFSEWCFTVYRHEPSRI